MVRTKIKEKLKSKDEIKNAAEILKKGGVVVFPTDTVYGVGCKFDDSKVVERIYKIKGTPKTQPMPVLIDSQKYLEKLGCKLTSEARKLIKEFWPGALTLIFNSKFSSLPAGKAGKIGLRMPNHPVTLALIKAAGFPIIGTSANFHREKVPKKYSELDKKFLENVDFVLKGKCTLKKESTVIDVSKESPKVIREGAIRVEL